MGLETLQRRFFRVLRLALRFFRVLRFLRKTGFGYLYNLLKLLVFLLIMDSFASLNIPGAAGVVRVGVIGRNWDGDGDGDDDGDGVAAGVLTGEKEAHSLFSG